MEYPKWFAEAVINYRAHRIAAILSDSINHGETLLDCGCGSMQIAEMLRKQCGINAFGADVIHLNQQNPYFCMCSGERLAFRNNCFDNVCLIFALHHMSDPLGALRECLRVTKKRLIILEDVYKNSLELALLEFFDYHAGNRFISESMSMPFNFRREETWITMFENLGTRLIAATSIRPNQWRPTRHRMFILEKNGR